MKKKTPKFVLTNAHVYGNLDSSALSNINKWVSKNFKYKSPDPYPFKEYTSEYKSKHVIYYDGAKISQNGQIDPCDDEEFGPIADNFMRLWKKHDYVLSPEFVIYYLRNFVNINIRRTYETMFGVDLKNYKKYLEIDEENRTVTLKKSVESLYINCDSILKYYKVVPIKIVVGDVTSVNFYNNFKHGVTKAIIDQVVDINSYSGAIARRCHMGLDSLKVPVGFETN